MLNIGLSLAGFAVAHKFISGAVAIGIAHKLANPDPVDTSILKDWYDQILFNGELLTTFLCRRQAGCILAFKSPLIKIKLNTFCQC